MTKNPDKSIEDTGERMIPSYHKGNLVFGEHITRYTAAAEIVKGKTVLDIASGSGYGSHLLSQHAKKIFGVDVDPTAIEYAKKNYKNDNLRFLLGDGKTIPLDNNSVDMVTSFETIEHIEAYDNFMKEIHRVLKDDGLLILSTPNKTEFPKGNHYHVHEFEDKELKQLIKKYFINHKAYYQSTWLHNMISVEQDMTKDWERTIHTIQTAPASIDKALYFYFLCSNRKINESVTPLAAISQHYSAREVQEYEESVRAHIEEQGKVMQDLEQRLNILQGRYRRIEKLRVRYSRFKQKLTRR